MIRFLKILIVSVLLINAVGNIEFYSRSRSSGLIQDKELYNIPQKKPLDAIIIKSTSLIELEEDNNLKEIAFISPNPISSSQVKLFMNVSIQSSELKLIDITLFETDNSPPIQS